MNGLFINTMYTYDNKFHKKIIKKPWIRTIFLNLSNTEIEELLDMPSDKLQIIQMKNYIS